MIFRGWRMRNNPNADNLLMPMRMVYLCFLERKGPRRTPAENRWMGTAAPLVTDRCMQRRQICSNCYASIGFGSPGDAHYHGCKYLPHTNLELDLLYFNSERRVGRTNAKRFLFSKKSRY